MMNQDDIHVFIIADINAIKRYDKDIQNTYIFIARRLYELKNTNYLEQIDFKGYKNIYDLALNEFGYEAAKTKYLIAIYLKFFNEYNTYDVNSKGKIINRYREFSISQLRYMCEMDDEQLKKCKPEMTVKEIKEIKLNFDTQNKATRVATSSVENSTILKNENIIEGVFPEKKEDGPEEKTNTIIISELPQEARKENKTIIVEINKSIEEGFKEALVDSGEEYYKKLHSEALEKIKALEDEKHNLEENLSNECKKRSLLESKYNEKLEMFKYFYEEYYNLLSIYYENDKIKKFASEFKNYVEKNKLPEKVNFFKNVV